jgi:PAS domain S-box-containing protein
MPMAKYPQRRNGSDGVSNDHELQDHNGHKTSHATKSLDESVPHTLLEKRQAAELETVYRTAPIGLALFDPVEFRYLRANDRQAEFFGCRPEQLIGKTVTEMAPIPALRELFEQVAAGTPVVNYPLEGELVGRPGEYRYWLVNYNPVYGSDGSVQAISAASLEITQQKKAELALMHNERLAVIGRLTAAISHEINNPLEAVTNLLYLIAQDSQLSSESAAYLEMAQAEIARAAKIVGQSLRFQRRSQDRTSAVCSNLVESVLQLFERKLRSLKIEIQREFECKRNISCIENEIKQVLTNLIENAIHSMPNGGRIRLRLRDARLHSTGVEGVRFSIADTGHGMSAETKARIFDAFFTTRAMDGNGIGLWISSDIVKRHNGSMRVRSSDATGKSGSVFSLFLAS